MAMVTQLRREPATDFRAALLMESLKATQPERPPAISVKPLEKRTSRVASTVALPADLRRRLVGRELRNSDRQLK